MQAQYSTEWTPQFSPWRHGGWYVDNVRYPSGAVGCVSRNYADRKWRIVCDERADDHTYPNRDAAARAERAIVEDMTKAALHADDIARGAVRVNDQRWNGMYCVLVPDPDVIGRWNTIESFKSIKQAEAYAAGYCARRDARTL